ncbi:MAG: hypothetical protein MUD12_11340 [Spirochaetes bacterium]|jgi:hypothetical protein|nr:hypothetical protein [Spirochaetota bacterium]
MKRIILVTVLVVCSAACVLSAVYAVTGSMELFPTSEQSGKVRLVSGSVAFLLAIMDIVIFRMLGKSSR